MKSLKAAAVAAGSLALAGAAAPAFATETADLTPTSLNGAVNTLTARAPGIVNEVAAQGPGDLMPLQSQSRALDTGNADSPLSTVDSATRTLNAPGGLLGGLPLKG
ncbi:hypothetical protein AB0M97_19115 [Streptomyces sp. NPDC051207]|uniref:hypothetical protein n=1 Tax=Streptomyces sp. NPDC051207 TaxID=3154641 RepID=UPI003430303A